MVDFFKFINVFIRSLYLTIKNGSGDLKYKDGRSLQYRTEYIIKIISLLIIKDILKNLRKTKKNYFLTEKEESIKNYIIWRIHLLNYEFVHFSVILDYHFQNICLREFKKKSSINILRKKLNLLKFFSIIYLTFATAFNNLIDIKSRFKKKYSLNISSAKNNSKGQKFGLMFSSIISKSPRNDLSLYDQLEKLGISHKEPIVIFDGEPYLSKEDIIFDHSPGYIICSLPKLTISFFAKLNIYLIKNFFIRKFEFWIFEYFRDEFNLKEKSIRKFIHKYNIKIIYNNNYLPIEHIFSYVVSTSKNKIKLIKRERSVYDIHDKWSRDFFKTDIYASICKRDKKINVNCNQDIYLPYKINLKNYNYYSALNTKISNCNKRILIMTSNISLNKNPFLNQVIHPNHMKPFLRTLRNYLLLNPNFGCVFKCKKKLEYKFLTKWLESNKEISEQIDIIIPSLGVPLLDLTKDYHHFLSLVSSNSSPSTNYELSNFIYKKDNHFIDIYKIYSSNFYLKYISGKKRLRNLPFEIHSDLKSYFSQININDMNLERKFNLKAYNLYCDNLLDSFIKQAKISEK